MRILEVIPRFNPILGGGVNVVYNVSKNLAKMGHDVTILTTRCKLSESTVNEMNNLGVEVIAFDYLFDFHLFIPSPSMKEWMDKNIKNYDIIHLNGARGYQNNIVLNYAKKYHVPYVLQPHGSILRIVEIQLFKKMYDFVWGYRIYKNASKVIALNQAESDACVSMGINKEKIEIIPNGIDLDEYANLPQKGEFKKKYNLKPNDKLILYLGRIHKSKGLDLLFKSYIDIQKQVDNRVDLIVAPDDGYGETIRTLSKKLNIPNNVIMTGPVNEMDKRCALVDADVFVTPRFYGFPITFVEACACGLPIVTTNSGDTLEWIDGVAGYITNQEDFSKAVVKIFNEPYATIEFRKNCKMLVKEKFNWITISKTIEHVYYSLRYESA